MQKSEVRDGMQIDWDVPIPMDDGIVLRADLFRPTAAGRYPVILSCGPYGKGMPFADSRPYAWEHLIREHPEVTRGSSCKYLNWEVVDPKKWVPDGYAVVRVDVRGTGRSPGHVDPWSPRETEDLYCCIEWTAAQPWSSGKVGLNGISYFAMNAWQVASLQPPHLIAICAWEGAGDHYRDTCYHGGIFCEFLSNWYPRAIIPMQHGVGEHGARNPITGEWVTGPETLAPDELPKRRNDIIASALAHPLDDDYHRMRSPVWERITVPLLSAANWGGHGLHPRGNFEGFMHAASAQKWLEVHGDTHWTEFYSDYGLDLQKRFFGHFLKGDDNGWDRQPRVQLKVRHPDKKFVVRDENEWPLARTQWTRFYLDPNERSLRSSPPPTSTRLDYEAMGDGLTFVTPPLTESVEICGPVAAKLHVSSSTTDADLFLVLRVFAANGKEIVFHGAQDPRTPVGLGWLRASHRKLDAQRSEPWRPYHTHDELWPLVPGEPVELDVEIWPTCTVVPPGHQIGLSIRGRDYEFDGPPLDVPGAPHPMRGVGPFLHDNPINRPREIFAGINELHFAPDQPNYVLLPIIPPR